MDDKISTMICKTCIQKIDNWEVYREKCSENQSKLQDWMKEWNKVNNSDTSIQIKDEPIDHIEDERNTEITVDSLSDEEEPVSLIYLSVYVIISTIFNFWNL